MRKKRIVTFLLLSLAFAVSTYWSFYSESNFLHTLINTLFLCALVFLMLGGSLLVLESGFFNFQLSSFKRFYRKTSKLEEYVSSSLKEKEDYVHSFSFSLTIPLLISGTILFLGAICLSLL